MGSIFVMDAVHKSPVLPHIPPLLLPHTCTKSQVLANPMQTKESVAIDRFTAGASPFRAEDFVVGRRSTCKIHNQKCGGFSIRATAADKGSQVYTGSTVALVKKKGGLHPHDFYKNKYLWVRSGPIWIKLNGYTCCSQRSTVTVHEE